MQFGGFCSVVLEVPIKISSKTCSNAWLKLQKSGYGWFDTVHFFGEKKRIIKRKTMLSSRK